MIITWFLRTHFSVVEICLFLSLSYFSFPLILPTSFFTRPFSSPHISLHKINTFHLKNSAWKWFLKFCRWGYWRGCSSLAEHLPTCVKPQIWFSALPCGSTPGSSLWAPSGEQPQTVRYVPHSHKMSKFYFYLVFSKAPKRFRKNNTFLKGIKQSEHQKIIHWVVSINTCVELYFSFLVVGAVIRSSSSVF